jgi:hypothetical protein
VNDHTDVDVQIGG